MRIPLVLLGLSLLACADVGRAICEGELWYEPEKPEIDAACLHNPSTVPMDPVVEWNWPGKVKPLPGQTLPNEVCSTPLVGQLTDDNGDSLFDGDDDPDVVFLAYEYDTVKPNVMAVTLVSLNGSTGKANFNVSDPVDSKGSVYRWNHWGVPAIGDVNGDGTPEICAPSLDADLVCVDHAGKFLFAASGTPMNWNRGAVTLADLNHDGQVEILRGDRIFSSTGALLAEANPTTAFVDRSAPVAVQLDADPEWEVVNGTRAFNLDGSIVWDDSTAAGVGVSAVADIDGDGLPEIVTASTGKVSLTEHDGMHTWTYLMPVAADTKANNLGPPLIADLDGDGDVEIGVSSPSFYTVLDASGAVVWQVPSKDHNNPSLGTGAVAFDFEGDGVYEIVHADAERIRVLDGKTGVDRWSQLTNGFDPTKHGSATIMEYATVADIDKDGSAEILIGSSWWSGVPTADWQGLHVIGSDTSSWRPARTVWNQYAYDVTNVADDGAIPIAPTSNWLAGNTSRTVEDTPEGGYYGVPNLFAQSLYGCEDECRESDPWTVYFSIANDGPAAATSFDVQLQDGVGAVIQAETVILLPSGETHLFGPWSLHATDWQNGPVRLVVDAAGSVDECDEADNELEIAEFCVY